MVHSLHRATRLRGQNKYLNTGRKAGSGHVRSILFDGFDGTYKSRMSRDLCKCARTCPKFEPSSFCTMDFGTYIYIYIYIFTVYVCVCDHIIYLNLYIYIYNYQYHIVSHIFEQCLSFLHATTSCKEEEQANHSMMAHNWSAHVCQTELGASCHRPALLQTSMAAVVLLVVCKLCLHISFSNCSAHSCEIMAPATETTWTVAERCIYYIIL